MRLYLLLFLILVFALKPANAQRFQYNIYQGETLPFKKVNQVIEDKLRYIWLATDQGLFRFN